MRAQNIFSGQKERYGDYYRQWKIVTKKTEFSEILKECREEFGDLPLESEWLKNIRGDKKGDMEYYFGGYCKLYMVGKDWHFIVVKPYAD